jgi:hypothetical protein
VELAVLSPAMSEPQESTPAAAEAAYDAVYAQPAESPAPAEAALDATPAWVSFVEVRASRGLWGEEHVRSAGPPEDTGGE